MTAVYYDKTTTSTKIPTVDIVVTYTDTNDTEQIILLKDITKICGTNSTKLENRRWRTHTITAPVCAIYQGTTSINVADYAQNLTDFPASLRPALQNLYNIYNNSGYINSNVTMGASLQAYPDWLTT